MRNEILEGELAVRNVLEGIQELASQKEEYIGKEDISIALLLHAITFLYESTEEESEASHMIMSIVTAILQGEYNNQTLKEILGISHIKH